MRYIMLSNRKYTFRDSDLPGSRLRSPQVHIWRLTSPQVHIWRQRCAWFETQISASTHLETAICLVRDSGLRKYTFGDSDVPGSRLRSPQVHIWRQRCAWFETQVSASTHLETAMCRVRDSGLRKYAFGDSDVPGSRLRSP